MREQEMNRERINFNFIAAARGEMLVLPSVFNRTKYPGGNMCRMFYKQQGSFNVDYYLRGKFLHE